VATHTSLNESGIYCKWVSICNSSEFIGCAVIVTKLFGGRRLDHTWKDCRRYTEEVQERAGELEEVALHRAYWTTVTEFKGKIERFADFFRQSGCEGSYGAGVMAAGSLSKRSKPRYQPGRTWGTMFADLAERPRAAQVISSSHTTPVADERLSGCVVVKYNVSFPNFLNKRIAPELLALLVMPAALSGLRRCPGGA
jgi:hypothetical protein